MKITVAFVTRKFSASCTVARMSHPNSNMTITLELIGRFGMVELDWGALCIGFVDSASYF